uniref:Uncharacterized protein n=1 Tax=Euplotes crassus TaxID=5936 RepID=A0A7S3KLE6_EUPCR|mmetsp:Transcript_33898/g.33425  ORF Transcript_33898/g.33425 Transcript_33898/m.33425 type:complete len:106 (+) Transcript_33898:92-409(+)
MFAETFWYGLITNMATQWMEVVAKYIHRNTCLSIPSRPMMRSQRAALLAKNITGYSLANLLSLRPPKNSFWNAFIWPSVIDFVEFHFHQTNTMTDIKNTSNITDE